MKKRTLKGFAPFITMISRPFLFSNYVAEGNNFLDLYVVGSMLWDFGEWVNNLYKFGYDQEIKTNFFEKRLIENVLYKPLKAGIEKIGIIKPKKDISSKVE